MNEQAWNFDLGELPFQAQLCRTVLPLTRSVDGAEDLFQDTHLESYRHHGTFRPGANLRASLSAILKDRFINEYRRRQEAPAVVVSMGSVRRHGAAPARR